MWRFVLTFVLICVLNASAQDRQLPDLVHPDNWMAIVGDSGVTGAASGANIEATADNLWTQFWQALTQPRHNPQPPPPAVFKAQAPDFAMDTVPPLTRVPYASSEISGNPVTKWWLNFMERLSLQIDTPEQSFGYLVGRKLGLAPSDIVLVGQDGVRVDSIAVQFERIFSMNTPTLPPLILISYTANDLCDEKVFGESVEARTAAFEQRLSIAWQKAAPLLKAHPRGTRIYVLAPFNVGAVMTSPGVLTQTVNVEGQGQITCGQLRNGDLSFSPSAFFVLRLLNRMCPSVTQTHLHDQARLDHIAKVQTAFIAAWERQIATLNAKYKSLNITWTLIHQTHAIPLEAGDVGKDCFHPSLRGHAKIAAEVLRALPPTKVFNP